MPTVHTSHLTVSAATIRRFFRVGSTPVLVVTVTHPVLTLPADADSNLTSATERFNEAYRAMAEAFCTHAEEKAAAQAVEAFHAAGRGAAYTFDRRILTCRMEAEIGDDGSLCVHRTVTRTSRRGSVPTDTREERDCWRIEDLSLTLRSSMPPFLNCVQRRRGGFSAKERFHLSDSVP